MEKKKYLSPKAKYVMLRTHGATLGDPSVTFDGEEGGFTLGSAGDGSDQASNEATWEENDDDLIDHPLVWSN